MALDLLAFSHVCIAVSDAEASLAFYRDVLGMQVFFDVELEGPSMESVTGESGAKGRMIGGTIAGTVVELLAFGHRAYERKRDATPLGYTNISFSVADIDAAYAAVEDRARPPVEIGGVRMFFLHDPDGTAIEIVGFPNAARTSAEMWSHRT